MFTVEQLLEQNSDLGLHDVLVEMDLLPKDDSTCRKVWDLLPEIVRNTAHAWGASDTEYRDEAFVYLRDTPGVLDPLKDELKPLPK